VKNEKWLDTTYNTLVLINRHLGRGFALGGFYFPKSRLSEETDYWAMLHGLNREIAYWRREIEEKKPSLVINVRKFAAVVSRRLGIAQRWLAVSRYENFHYWAMNEFFENPAFERAYRHIAAARPVTVDEPYKGHMDYRDLFNKQTSLSGTINRAFWMLVQRTWWRLRGYQKGRNYYMFDELRYVFRRRRQLIATTGHNAVPLEKIKGQRFIFFPLHAEPEAALQGLSPEYFYQLSCIAALARDLPAGVLLVVKDTYVSMGVRPDNFYDQIKAFKNVVLLDTMTLGVNVVREAELVATITGTAGFEAAVAGKPVISFGHHNIFNCLPHVRFISDERDLKPALDAFLSESFDRNGAQQSGARYLAAVVQESFDLAAFDLRNREKVSEESCDRAYEALVASLLPLERSHAEKVAT
jgi:hypothetical protein